MLNSILSTLKKNAPFHLYDVDYNDDLSDNQEVLQEFIDKWYAEDYGIVDHWDLAPAINYILDEYLSWKERKRLLHPDNAVAYDEVLQLIYDNDESDPIADLLNNTPRQLVQVDLDFWFSEPPSTVEEATSFIKEAFMPQVIQDSRIIPGSYAEKLFVQQVLNVRQNAPYWGNAVLIMNVDVSDFSENTKPNIYLKADEYYLCILNSTNGSWDVDLVGFPEIVIPRSNVKIDALTSYSFNETFWPIRSNYDGDVEPTERKTTLLSLS